LRERLEPIYDIELAVEHEGQVKDVDTLLKKEIQHLIDIKAKNKVGIFLSLFWVTRKNL
jgi:hypothetical protein